MKKSVLVFGLAVVAVVLMIYAGIDALNKDRSTSGLFFTFIGSCTAIGLGIDIAHHIKTTLRRNKVKKLGR